MFALKKMKKEISVFSSQIFAEFSVRIVPLKRLKFQEIGFHEKVSKIYEDKESTAKVLNKSAKILKFSILTAFLPLLLQPSFTTLALNLIIQPFIVKKAFINNNEKTFIVDKIYLLKNGRQLFLKTMDNHNNLISVKDILEVNKNKESIVIKTFDKKFYLNSKNILENYIMKNILERFEIDTRFSLNTYNRFTFEKKSYFLKEQTKREKIFFTLRNRQNINHLKLLSGKISQKNLFYHRKNDIRNFSKDKFYETKKKNNLLFYPDNLFERKFGMNIIKFLGKLNSSENERIECQQIVENAPTLGRYTLNKFEKKIKI